MPAAFSRLLVLENSKNIRHNFFADMKKPVTYVLINMFSPTFAPNLVT